MNIQIPENKLWKDHKGFTLIEILIIVAIIGVLAAIVIPQFTQFKKRAYDADAQANLHNVYMSCRVFWADAGGAEPCSLSIAKYSTYGFSQSAEVDVDISNSMTNTEYDFLAAAQHSKSDNRFTINYTGIIKLASFNNCNNTDSDNDGIPDGEDDDDDNDGVPDDEDDDDDGDGIPDDEDDDDDNDGDHDDDGDDGDHDDNDGDHDDDGDDGDHDDEDGDHDDDGDDEDHDDDDGDHDDEGDHDNDDGDADDDGIPDDEDDDDDNDGVPDDEDDDDDGDGTPDNEENGNNNQGNCS